ncbi:MAG: hypothetical protein HY015_04415 [Bacteroidetes bacterium]|nr:hypothetical protein [Bacteroidota bacterium]MBI3482204.1 hypothetical protein [Bacteroidota bacterium]
MKLTTFLVAALIVVSSACSEKHLDASQVPTVVKDSFEKKYPTATNVEWIKEGSSKVIYEAEFKMDGKEITAEFSETGEFLEEE